MEHENRMIEKQQEFEKSRRDKTEKKRIADKIVKMEDTDQPDANFKRFEDIMKEAEIEKEEWPRRLSVLLSGKALVAYANTVPMEAKGDYNALKEALLQALGLTAEHCRLDVWTLNKRYGESWQELARRIDSMISRGTQGYKTLEEVNNIMAMYKFLSLCPADAVNYVQVRQPKSRHWKLLIWYKISSAENIIMKNSKNFRK